jgi:hypothetical protein
MSREKSAYLRDARVLGCQEEEGTHDGLRDEKTSKRIFANPTQRTRRT